MNTSKEQLGKRQRGRRGWWRRISTSAGLALALFAAGGAAAGSGLFSSGSTASAAPNRPVRSVRLAPKRSVTAAKPSETRVWGGWRAPQAQVGHTAQLSAGTLPQAAPGVRMGYRWTIVSKPKGSRARLIGASSAHPTFRPDHPGYYVLQVTTGALPAGATSGRLSSCAQHCKTRRLTSDCDDLGPDSRGVVGQHDRPLERAVGRPGRRSERGWRPVVRCA